MKVPIYEQQVRPTAAAPTAPSEGLFQANQQLGNTMQGLGQLMQQRAMERQLEKDNQQVLETETKLRQDMDNLLYNNDDGIFTTRLLNNAENSTADFKNKTEELKGKYLGSLPGDDQKVQFAQIIESHFQSRLSSVARHEAEQFRAARGQAEKDSDNQSMAEIMRDPSLDNVLRILANRTAQQEVFMTQEGYDEQSKDLNKKNTAGRFAAAAILRTLEIGGDTAAARQMYDTFKEALATLPPEAAIKLEASVKDAEFTEVKTAIYGEAQKFKLADGMSDTVKMEKYVFDLKGFSSKEKEEIWSFVKAKSGEDDTQRRQWIASNDRNFFNELYNYHDQQKRPLKEALKLSTKYGRDSFDQGEKMRDIMRLYAEDTAGKNDSEIPEIYLDLWQGIKFGEITRSEQINAAYDNGLITKAHFYELRKDLDEIRLSGIKADEKLVWDRIATLAPKNTNKKAQFMIAVKEATKGKTPEEAYEIAENIKKKNFSTTVWDAITGGWKNESFQKWQKEYKSQGITLSTTAELNRTIGAEVVTALGGNVDAVLRIANGFGGPYNLRIGTPQNNAIRSLTAFGQPVTQENIVNVLRQFPDGRVPPTAVIEFGNQSFDNQESIIRTDNRWGTTQTLKDIKPVIKPNQQRSFLDIAKDQIKNIKPIENQ